MTTPPKDDTIRAVCAELDELMARLRANVDALTAILGPPPGGDGHGQEVPA